MGYKADMSGVKAKINKICTNTQLGQFLASTAAEGMDQYVPFDTGALSWSASVDSSGWAVSYNVPYAAYVYYGYGMKFNTEHHPNATSEWDRAYAATSGQQLADAGTQFIRERL